eukprot:gene16884-biopygen11035
MVKWGHEFGGAGQQGNSSLALPASAEGAMMTAAGFGIPLVASPIHGGQLSTRIFMEAGVLHRASSQHMRELVRELVRGGIPSSFVAGPLETLREINGSVVAERAPTRSSRECISNSHGFPKTFESL